MFKEPKNREVLTTLTPGDKDYQVLSPEQKKEADSLNFLYESATEALLKSGYPEDKLPPKFLDILQKIRIERSLIIGSLLSSPLTTEHDRLDRLSALVGEFVKISQSSAVSDLQ